MQILFDVQQRVIIDAMVSTLSQRHGNGRDVITIGGYAGTGKTSCIKAAIDASGIDVAVATFTGKAASVLRNKGVEQAQTLHSLMYHFDAKTREFYRRNDLGVKAVIVDEASMLNGRLHRDLMSFRVPVVFVGDHGQLEPIGDNPGVMLHPDLCLETIYRQGEGSAILDVAHAFRAGKQPTWRAGSEAERVPWNDAMARILDYDIVLCGLNDTRHRVNAFIRKQERRSPSLEEGEVMVCLRNNEEHGVYNGMLLTVKRIIRTSGADIYLDLEEEGGRALEGARCRLMGPTEDVNAIRDRDIVALDYGSALTVHKSQGSEYGDVLVIDERPKLAKWDMRRWRYTAATRASKHLTWIS